MCTAQIFKYPVCKTEVLNMRVDHTASTAQLLEGSATISGLECINNTRLLPTSCTISQS